MARKLKTYQTSLGFFDLAIAAPSMKAALEAWGADSNLFHQGAAKESNDPDIIAATMAKPGVVLKKLKIAGADAVAIGDTPYDAEAAGKAKIATIGMLCGGFTESLLRQAGCVEIYSGPAALFARFPDSLLAS